MTISSVQDEWDSEENRWYGVFKEDGSIFEPIMWASNKMVTRHRMSQEVSVATDFVLHFGRMVHDFLTGTKVSQTTQTTQSTVEWNNSTQEHLMRNAVMANL